MSLPAFLFGCMNGFMLKGQIIHDIMSESESEACLHGYGERRN